jgi:Zn-dependent protease with chaperone function
MKTFFIIIAILFLSYNSFSQFTLNLEGSEIKSGQKVILTEISGDTYGWGPNISKNGGTERITFGELKKFRFEVTNLAEFWKSQALFNEVYESLTKYGMQYDLRQDWENEALRYLNEISQKQLIFEDSYLENYLYSLTYKLYPGSINDGRPGILNVKIMIDNAPNAFIFPNGSMIISTGLLSTINSEEELIGVMAHEISHFVLDHSTINLNKAIQRQKNAEFWAAFATVVAAAGEVYVASNNNYYYPGALTYSTAILSSAIAASFTERLGLKYTKEQEFAADKCATELMKFLKIDPTALSSALSKIKDYCTITGNYYAISGEGTHPNLIDRINKIGKPNEFSSVKYDKLVSFVNSANAVIEFNNRHFKACQTLVDRNIKTGVPTEDDYILKAMTNLYLYDNEQKNSESLELINKAKKLNVAPTINVYKQEALILLRLGKLSESITAFTTYNEKLDQELSFCVDIKDSNSWYYQTQYLNEEKTWTSKMIYKVKSM